MTGIHINLRDGQTEFVRLQETERARLRLVHAHPAPDEARLREQRVRDAHMQTWIIRGGIMLVLGFWFGLFWLVGRALF